MIALGYMNVIRDTAFVGDINYHTLKAPVQAGETVGSVTYYLKDFKIKEYPLVITKSVPQKTFIWYLQKLFTMYMLK